MQKYSGFIPRETWGNNLIGAKNRYLREEWDERHCNQIIGSRTGKNCIGIRLGERFLFYYNKSLFNRILLNIYFIIS